MAVHLLRCYSLATKRLYQYGGTSWSSLLLTKQQRFFAADQQEDLHAEEKKKSPLELFSSKDNWDRLLKTTGTGTGQVLFLNSNDAGTVILISLALADPMVALMAGTGSLVSSITAETTLSSSKAAGVDNGLFSYNGCLVGCATAALLCPGSFVTALPLTIIGAAAATYVTAIPMTAPMPQWTIAFNLLTYTTLLALYNKPVVGTVTTVDPVTTTTTTLLSPTIFDLIVSPLTGISQIFLVESALSGFGIVLAVARYSPQLALHAVFGSAVGGLTGAVCLGADVSTIAAGLWGYNSALTSVGTAVFLRSNHSDGSTTTTVWLVSGVGASLTAVTFGALNAVSPVPCLTIPFCLVMSGIWSMAQGKLVNGVALSNTPHSPERNQF